VDPGYVRQVRTALDAAFARTPAETVELEQARLVIFSDHHKGARDGADDFQRCERAYCAALAHYLDAGFRLLVLGDAEELWEENPKAVLRGYHDVLALEAQFAGRGGLERFFGNHDDLWESPRQVRRHLHRLFPALGVREALKLRVTHEGRDRGLLFFVHGHQGTTESDRFGRLSRIPVRYIWRPLQRKLGFSATTPAIDFGLRGKHDRAMFEWARTCPTPVVLIAGHTHRPVFSLPATPARSSAEIERELAEAQAGGQPARVRELRAELEFSKATQRDRAARALRAEPPCYFNAGCCSFPDGDVTGLEIADGEIRLVRWPDDMGDPRRKELGRKRLADVLEEVKTTAAQDARILEQPLAPR
jgi:hypothetical protein